MAELTNISTQQLEELLQKAGSKFLLVSLAAKRACQLNDYANGLGRGTGVIPPLVSDIAHTPLNVAFAEIAEDKIVAKKSEPEKTENVLEMLDSFDLPDIQAEIEELDIFS